MANLYLMQALYAPKPPHSTPSPAVSALDGMQRQQTQSATPEQAIHEPPEPDSEATARWKPTGANVQSVGIKSELPSSDAADRFLESLPSFPGNIAVTPSSPSSMTLPDGLTYPIERYLPPAGPYYDQNALLPVFGPMFFKYKPCMICWTCHPAAGYSTTSCGKVCKVCGTRRHPDESCSLFYCNRDWYRQQEIPCGPNTLRDRQIRPDKQELAVLSYIGVMYLARGPNNTVLVNPRHPIVQNFYKDKPRSKALMRKIFEAEPRHHSASIPSRRGPTLVANAPQQQPLPPPMGSYTIPIRSVDNSLDPRLQGRTSYGAPGQLALPQPDTASNSSETPTDPEDIEKKLQDQEVENLNLRMQAVVKDREIRKLRAELEQLRAQAADTGGAY
ncbi:hypothetical protein J4E85_009804 [Alternaria conjuncta]|uniref:uncharacterized protein n=1 Tax=Alternaria conjuncta TaxID=181017 RepID=UPI00221F7548|nr:uncharacterized protein J4E85_009804 [Alternaria conjuncta]KAI4917712.1 hypothetical protein J4E85_009804 [Alternaria conjuncta]